jgi:hypothetical protein
MGGHNLHTPWNLDCGSIVMGGEIVASRVAPEAATGEDVRAIHSLIAAAPDLLEFVRRQARLNPVFAKGNDKQIIAEAIALVAKAEGRS